MKNPSNRLLVYSALMTLGVILMLIGISWLMFFGLALNVLATYSFPQKRARGGIRLFLFLSGAAVFLLISDLHDGDSFVQKTRPLWFWVVLAGAWLFGIISEFRRYQKSKSLP